jgi:hypothetical protein
VLECKAIVVLLGRMPLVVPAAPSLDLVERRLADPMWCAEHGVLPACAVGRPVYRGPTLRADGPIYGLDDAFFHLHCWNHREKVTAESGFALELVRQLIEAGYSRANFRTDAVPPDDGQDCTPSEYPLDPESDLDSADDSGGDAPCLAEAEYVTPARIAAAARLDPGDPLLARSAPRRERARA